MDRPDGRSDLLSAAEPADLAAAPVGSAPTADGPDTAGALTAALCREFASVLEVPAVGPDTDFFLAGGHSLAASALASSVERLCGTRVRVRDVFECPTPQALALRVGQRPEPEPPEPRTSNDSVRSVGDDVTQLPDVARWLWRERQRGVSGGSQYTVPCLFDGVGELEPTRLARAVELVLWRHPILRAVFAEHRGVPQMTVTDQVDPLEVVDLRGSGEPGPALAAEVQERIDAPFDLSVGPLCRVTVFLRSAGAWSLLLVADHLVCDGSGLRILAEDLVEAYTDPDGAEGRRPPPAATQSGASGAGPSDTTMSGPGPSPQQNAALRYWRASLSPPPPPLPLPVSRRRHAPTARRCASVSLPISQSTMDKLDEAGTRSHAGRFVAVTAALVHTLGLVTGCHDICVGTPVDRRTRLGRPRAVGFYVSTVALRLTVPPRPDWIELLDQVAARVVDAVDHSDVTFDEIVAALDPPREQWRTPFFDVWVAVYPYITAGRPDRDEIGLRGGPVPPRQGLFELSFQFIEQSEGQGTDLTLQYDTERYDGATAHWLAELVAADLVRLAEGTEPLTELPVPGSGTRRGSGAFSGFHFD